MAVDRSYSISKLVEHCYIEVIHIPSASQIPLSLNLSLIEQARKLISVHLR